MAALALICTNSLFAGEPGGAASSGDKKATARGVIRPPYAIEPPDMIRIEMLNVILITGY